MRLSRVTLTTAMVLASIGASGGHRAHSQAASQLCQAAGAGPACIGAFTKGGMGGGGMGGMDGAATAIGLGLTLFSILQDSDQQTVPAATQGTPAHPANLGGYTTYSAPSASQTNTFLTDQQKRDLIDQLRPLDISTGAPGTAGTSVQLQKDALLGRMRSLDTPVQPAGQARSAADQLCIAAGKSAGCLDPFSLHNSSKLKALASRIPTPAERQASLGMADAMARLTALAAGPAATADPGRPCSRIVGFAVQGDNVSSQTAPCSAATPDLTGTDEGLSEQARVPFDTAAASTGSAPAVFIKNPAARVALLSSPVTPKTLEIETKQLKIDECAQIGRLENRLAGYATAIRRLQKLSPTLDAERADWQTQWDDVARDAWKDLGEAVIGGLNAHLDHKVEELNEEALRALNLRIDVADPNVRQQYDIVFRALVAQRKIVLWDRDFVVAVLDRLFTGFDVADLFGKDKTERDRLLDGSKMILELLGRGDPIAAPAEALTNAGLDLMTEYASYVRLSSLNAAEEQRMHAFKKLEARMNETISKIQAARKDAARSGTVCHV